MKRIIALSLFLLICTTNSFADITTVQPSGDITVATNGAVTVTNLTFGSDAQDDVAVRGASAYGRLAIAEQRVLGRITGGHLAGLTLGNAATNVFQVPADPAANTLLGWDDTDNTTQFLTLGSGLSYDHASHTLSVSAGSGNLSYQGTISANTLITGYDATHVQSVTTGTGVVTAAGNAVNAAGGFLTSAATVGNLTASTSAAVGIGTIELGAASDNTLSRLAAGILGIEGNAAMVSSLTTNAIDAANGVWGASNGMVFEGATANAYETTLTVTDPTADRTITLPDATTTLIGKNTPITQCAVIPAAATTDDLPIFKAPAALTIVASSIHVYAIGGTNVVGGLDECTGTNGVCSSVTAVDSDITGTAGSDVADDGTLTNAGIASGNWIQWHTTSVSGTNTSLSVCFSYTLD